MRTRAEMGAFLENPMFLFMDDSEAVLPVFRATDYGDRGRIVELTDVGCDTETTFPIHFPRGAFDRRRGGAESLGSTCKIAKWLNDKPKGFTRRATDVNSNEGRRNENHTREKTRRDDYSDVYIADPDYNDLYGESLYDELPKNDSAVEEEDEYHVQFVKPRNAIARSSRRERIPRYDYSRNIEPSFTQKVRVPQRRSNSPQWFAENNGRNIREMHGTNVQLGERKKRTKILSRTNGNSNRGTEFGKNGETVHHKRDNLPKPADSVAPGKNFFWDFISFENDADEETTFYNPTKTKNHGGLQKMAPHRNRSYIFDRVSSQPKHPDTINSEEEEFRETLKKDRQENISPEIPINSAPYWASKSNTKEKPKIMRLNTSNATSSRGSSNDRNTSTERISNVYPAEKNSVIMRPHSATEGKKIKSQTIEKREEITSATRTTIDRPNKFDKLSNNFPKETGQSTRTFNRVANSKSNGRIYTANERKNMNSHGENSGNSEMDRINVSRLVSEEKITRNERTFALRMTGASAPRADMEKEKERKFFSRLPIRTWKRLRTKEPAALRPENDATSGDVNRKLQGTEDETADDHSERVKNDDVRMKERAAANRSDVKRNEHFGGSLSAEPELTSSDLKSVKRIKGLTAARGNSGRRVK